jgi:hypothetical protein
MLLFILLLAVLLLLVMLLYSESLRQKQNEREQVFLSFPPLPIYTDNRFFGKNRCVSPDTWNKCITGSTNSDTTAREEKKEREEKEEGAAGGHGGGAGLQETGEEHAVFAGETGEEGGRAGGEFGLGSQNGARKCHSKQSRRGGVGGGDSGAVAESIGCKGLQRH